MFKQASLKMMALADASKRNVVVADAVASLTAFDMVVTDTAWTGLADCGVNIVFPAPA
jgi:hypothetical protein